MAMLDKRVAFITGGASGIGAGTAHRFAEEGALIALADVQTEEGEHLREEITSGGGTAIYTHCDVSDPASVKGAIDMTVKEFGRLDIVFANAGINGMWTPIEELQPEEWDKTIDINLKGTYLTVHFAVPHLKKAGGGSIIITSSVNGTRTFSNPGASAYSTSKAGQVAFMKMIALELGRHNIRCNAICPGAIRTNIDQRTQQRHTERIGIEVELPQGNPAIDEGKGDTVEVADTCLFPWIVQQSFCNFSRATEGMLLCDDIKQLSDKRIYRKMRTLSLRRRRASLPTPSTAFVPMAGERESPTA